MYESEAEQTAFENRTQARNEGRARADDYHAGSWVVGQLRAARRAPYHHAYGESDSFYITVQTSAGRRQFWGKDLERAFEGSKSHVRIGDTVGVRITRQDKFTVLNDAGRSEQRTFNHFEVEKATYIVARLRAARHIVEDSLTLRNAPRDGKVVAASTLVANAAETLADVYRLNPHRRASFVEGIKAAAGLPTRAVDTPNETQPATPAGKRAFEQRRADEFRRGAWIEGRLTHIERAPYRHDPRNGESTLITLEASYGTQPIWGTDLERAVSRSRSHVKVGDLVAVRITQTDSLTGNPAHGSSAGRSFNRYEVETQRYIARREQLAREILDDPTRARREGRSGKMTEAAYLLTKAANMLADAQLMDDPARKAFIAGVKAAAAIPRGTSERIPGRVTQSLNNSTHATRPPHELPAREAFARE